MLKGLVAGFGGGLSSKLADYIRLGIDSIRQGPTTPDIDQETLEYLLGEFVGQPIKLLWILGGQGYWTYFQLLTDEEIYNEAKRLVRAAKKVGLEYFDIEIINEPDLGGGLKIPPEKYAALVRSACIGLEEEGFQGRVLCCGVFNHEKDAINYIKSVVQFGIPDNVIICPHRYSIDQNPQKPRKNFNSREQEQETIENAAQGRQTACSEYGFSTCEGIGPKQLVANHLWELDFGKKHHLYGMWIYQENDGKGWECYGLKDIHGNWKPEIEKIFSGGLRLVADKLPEKLPDVAVKFDGVFLGMEPNSTYVYGHRTDQPSQAGDYERWIVERVDELRFHLKSYSTNKYLSLTPHRTIESRDVAQSWETFYLSKQKDGSKLVYRLEDDGELRAVTLKLEEAF